MNRAVSAVARHADTIVVVCGAVLTWTSFYMPRWLAVPICLVGGAMIWNFVYVRHQQARFTRQLKQLQDEMLAQLDALGGERKDTALRLWIKQLGPNEFNIQYELKADLDACGLHRLAAMLLQAAGELNLRSERMGQNQTDQHPGGVNPSPN